MSPWPGSAPKKRPDPGQWSGIETRVPLGIARGVRDRMTDTLRTGLAATFSLRTVSRAAFGCLLGAALLAPGTPARAGDTDDGVPIDTKIIRGILEGFGLRRDGSESISYRERAPLVLPPTHTLPPPENSGAALANNPAWPVDPDVKRRKEEAAQERNVSIHADVTLLRRFFLPAFHVGIDGPSRIVCERGAGIFRRRESMGRREHQWRALPVTDRFTAVASQAEALENAANDFGVDRHAVVVIAGAGRGAGHEQDSAEQAAESRARNRPQAECGRQACPQCIGHPIPYTPCNSKGNSRFDP